MSGKTKALVGHHGASHEAIQRLWFYSQSFCDFERSCHLPWSERKWMQRRLGAEARRLHALFEAQLLAARRAVAVYPVGSPMGEWCFTHIVKAIASVAESADDMLMFVEHWRTESAPIPALPPDFVAVLTVEPANLIAPLPPRAKKNGEASK